MRSLQKDYTPQCWKEKLLCIKYLLEFSLGANEKLSVGHFEIEHVLQLQTICKIKPVQTFQISTACIHIGEGTSCGHYQNLRRMIDARGKLTYLLISDHHVTKISKASFNNNLKYASYVLFTAMPERESQPTNRLPLKVRLPLNTMSSLETDARSDVRPSAPDCNTGIRISCFWIYHQTNAFVVTLCF